MISYVTSQKDSYWQERELDGTSKAGGSDIGLEITGEYKQVFQGFGGCFNEQSYDTLQNLEAIDQDQIYNDLFTKEGLNLTVGRLPIGANDYALEWYSYDETDGDYDLKDFSIDRDKGIIIPYVKEALKRCPDMYFFASPWSPPTWMKTKKAYNYGTLKQDDKTLKAYAQYFVKYVKAFAQEGIPVSQIHVQNEPMADQKFPSCKWTGEEYQHFIKNFLGPVFEEAGLDTELWVGTINGPFVDMQMGMTPFEEFFDGFINTILSDPGAQKYISGCGFQWGGKHVLEQTELAYPELRIMQTENECGDGVNSWTHAEYVSSLFWQYLYHSAERYTYWNMVLPEGGISTWGWKQNTMISVNEETKSITYNPEFYIMKHYSHFIQPGAKYVRTKGKFAANSTVFENPNGEIILVVNNAMNRGRAFCCEVKGQVIQADLEAHSVNTFVVK